MKQTLGNMRNMKLTINKQRIIFTSKYFNMWRGISLWTVPNPRNGFFFCLQPYPPATGKCFVVASGTWRFSVGTSTQTLPLKRTGSKFFQNPQVNFLSLSNLPHDQIHRCSYISTLYSCFWHYNLRLNCIHVYILTTWQNKKSPQWINKSTGNISSWVHT